MKERNIFVRIICAFGWFMIIYLATSAIIGGVVGGMAGISTTSYEAGAIAGQNASIDFFEKNGIYVLVSQILLFSILASMGKLPDTTSSRGK